MKVALIATLGFDEKFCYRAILRHGIKEGDKIVLFTAEVNERVLKAYEWIKKLVRTSFASEVEVKLIQLDISNLENSIKRFLDEIRSLGDSKIIVNLSGGMRALVVIVLLGCIMLRRKNLEIEIETEDFSNVIVIQETLISLVGSEINTEKLEVLKLVKDGYRDVRSISKELRKDSSTVRRHLSDLEKMGLIEIHKRKPLIVVPSHLALLFV